MAVFLDDEMDLWPEQQTWTYSSEWDVLAPLLGTSPKQRLYMALLCATRAAVEANDAPLSRLLQALVVGHGILSDGSDRDLAWIEGKGSACACADRFLQQRAARDKFFVDAVPYDRMSLLRRVLTNHPALKEQPGAAFGHRYLPVDVEHLVFDVVGTLRCLHAELVLGRPQDGWLAARKRMIAAVTRVALRDESAQRTPLHYLMAILRGWGLSTAQVRDATKRL
jgi:hypothetical protein